MSARAPFFAPSTRAPSRASFTADPNNPLHAHHPGDRTSSDQPKVSKGGGFGLGNLKQKRMSLQEGDQKIEMASTTSTVSIIRPGTADPLAMARQGRSYPNQSVLMAAPTPQNPVRLSPNLLVTDGTFRHTGPKSPLDNLPRRVSLTALDDNGHAHQPTRNVLGPPLGPNVFEPELSQYRPHTFSRLEEAVPMPGHEFTEDGRVKMVRKRMRDDSDENDSSSTDERHAKRIKGLGIDDDKMSHRSAASPNIERPSSGMSSLSGSYRRRPTPSLQEVHQPQSHSNDRSEHFGTNMNLPPSDNQASFAVVRAEKPSNQPRGLDKVLGRDTAAIVEANMDAYDRFVKKWTDCSLADWKSGAEHLAGGFKNCLEFAQKHMDKKLIAYTKLDDNADSHDNALHERSRVLESARVKLVQESQILG